VATVGGVALAVPVGLLFDGTPLPLSISIFLQAVLGLALMGFMVRVDARLTT
jgi:DHA1 family bicyclomycin/chloramphenicol resistance-like MFS transporter